MGCFSFLCKNSGKPALSTSFSGSPCKLYLLKNGNVIEEMHGNYDSYGRVFKNDLRKDVPLELYDSFEWEMDWNGVCNLMSSPNACDGIAMVLDKYDNGTTPTTRSENDPNQGWGGEDDDDSDECLFFSTDAEKFLRVENPYHKIY